MLKFKKILSSPLCGSLSKRNSFVEYSRCWGWEISVSVLRFCSLGPRVQGSGFRVQGVGSEVCLWKPARRLVEALEDVGGVFERKLSAQHRVEDHTCVCERE